MQVFWVSNDGPLTYHVLHNLRCQRSLLGETHLSRVGGGGLPFRRCAGSSLFHHPVDLLQRQTFGLGDQEVGVDEANGAEGTPDPEDIGAKVAFVLANHVGGDDSDDLDE